MDEMLAEFLTESNEMLDDLDQELVTLEENPTDSELTNAIFRKLHTIKGTCGFFELSRLEAVSHKAEDVLDNMRSDKLEITADNMSPVLKAVDRIRFILEKLHETGTEPEGDDEDVIQELLAVLNTASTVEMADPSSSEAAAEESESKESSEQEEAEVTEPDSEESEETKEIEKEANPVKEEKKSAPPQESAKAPQKETSLRVGVDILEKIMNLVGELVLVRNQLLQLTQDESDYAVASSIQNLNFVTSDLQDTVMKTRMQPIGNAWAKLPRIVRDLSRTTGKKINLVMKGEDTELDRQVLQAIQDPLTHMVRNSADHGIESIEERLEAGKDPEGTVEVNAYHEGGYIIIEIKDDGKGMDPQMVLGKAIEKGLITEEESRGLTDSQILNFIFEPGFSTAQQVTSVSGRGVGMDVVRTNIESIGGTVGIQSKKGDGTSVKVKIPLTLAIVSALILNIGEEVYAIPQISVLELVRLSNKNHHLIEEINDTKVLRLRESLLPLIYLEDVLQIDVEQEEGKERSVIVTQIGDSQFGLVVNEVQNTQEIVVKSVGSIISEIPFFSGTTILGDGRVIMILDPSGIADKVGILNRSKGQPVLEEAHDDGSREEISFLLYRSYQKNIQAVPLSLVDRLEEFSREKLEIADGKLLIQYRGGLLPLVPADKRLLDQNSELLNVIVFSEGSAHMGLIVDKIEDIVTEKIQLESEGRQSGILGVGIINGRASEVIDIYYHIKQTNPKWFSRVSSKSREVAQENSILLIDNSQFFRNILVSQIESLGFHVKSCLDTEEATQVLENGYKADTLIINLETEFEDGIDFAKKLMGADLSQKIHLLGLGSQISDEDKEVAHEAGFEDFIDRFHKEGIIEFIKRINKRQNMKDFVSYLVENKEMIEAKESEKD